MHIYIPQNSIRNLLKLSEHCVPFAVLQRGRVAEESLHRSARTMRSTLLKSICVLFMLRALVAMGFPTNTDKKATSEENSIEGDTAVNDADTSDKIYTCVYIPPELENCNFSR